MNAIRTKEIADIFYQTHEPMKSVQGYDGRYKVTASGKVYSFCFPTIKEKATSYINSGYKCVSLSKNKKSVPCLVHRVVATTYISNPNSLPCVNHIDGDKGNNCVDNLEWVTYRDNLKHAFNTNLAKIKLSLVEAEEIRTLYITTLVNTKDLARSNNVTLKVILDILQDKIWTPTKYPKAFVIGSSKRNHICTLYSNTIREDFLRHKNTYKTVACKYGIAIGSLQHILAGGVISRKGYSNAEKRNPEYFKE